MRAATTLLILCVGALTILGMVVLYSASMVQAGARFLGMQLVWCGVGVVACAFTAWFDYRWLRRLAWPLAAIALVLLALVLTSQFGVVRGGARRWFSLGFASFQPSELAKLAVIIALASYAEWSGRRMRGFKDGILFPGLLLCPFLVLIILEPDFGNTIMLAAVGAVMIFLAGARWAFILPMVFAGAVILGIAIFNDPIRRARVEGYVKSLRDPEEEKKGINYQGYQSVRSIGAGGLTGVGLGNGRQKLGFVPEHHTDFIFSVIGEELGFAATIGVVAAFMAVVVSGVWISCHAGNTFGFLLGNGITFLIGFQAFINLGVVTMVLPNKGMPLPFISYGGSNLLFMLVSVGILLSIARHSEAETAPAESLTRSGRLAEA